MDFEVVGIYIIVFDDDIVVKYFFFLSITNLINNSYKTTVLLKSLTKQGVKQVDTLAFFACLLVTHFAWNLYAKSEYVPGGGANWAGMMVYIFTL